MTNEQSSQEFFDAVIRDIKSDQVSKGIIASGKSAESLKSTVNPTGGQLIGAGYFQQQITGRGPGKQPPVDDILEWIKYKRIQSPDPESLAWAISLKIKKLGTSIYQGSRKGLDFDGIVGKNKEELIKNLIDGTTEQVKTNLRDAMRQ